MRIGITGSWQEKDREAWGLRSNLQSFADACRELGIAIAQSGAALTVGSDSPFTADRYAVEGYLSSGRDCSSVRVIRPNKEGPSPFIDSYEKNPNSFVYLTGLSPKWQHTRHLLASDVDALITIGGADGTYQAGLELGLTKKRLVPIGAFGGASSRLLRELLASNSLPKHFEKLDSPWIPRLAFEVVATLVKDLSNHTEAAAPKPRYYVSYAWNDDTPAGKDREEIVDKLCEEAAEHGTPILRDKKVLGFGDNIVKFMKDIGKGDRVFVILSDKYLKSPFCMFELFEMWRNSRQDEEEFRNRCRVFTLGDAEVWTVLGRLKYAKHWKMQFDEVANAVKEVGPAVLGESDYAQFKLMQDFVNHVGNVLATFAKNVQPRSFNDLVKYGFDDPPEAQTVE